MDEKSLRLDSSKSSAEKQNNTKEKRRTSILKPPKARTPLKVIDFNSSEESKDPDATRRTSRRVSFAGFHVKEFGYNDGVVWGATYFFEASKSDSSSQGSNSVSIDNEKKESSSHGQNVTTGPCNDERDMIENTHSSIVKNGDNTRNKHVEVNVHSKTCTDLPWRLSGVTPSTSNLDKADPNLLNPEDAMVQDYKYNNNSFNKQNLDLQRTSLTKALREPECTVKHDKGQSIGGLISKRTSIDSSSEYDHEDMEITLGVQCFNSDERGRKEADGEFEISSVNSNCCNFNYEVNKYEAVQNKRVFSEANSDMEITGFVNGLQQTNELSICFDNGSDMQITKLVEPLSSQNTFSVTENTHNAKDTTKIFSLANSMDVTLPVGKFEEINNHFNEHISLQSHFSTAFDNYQKSEENIDKYNGKHLPPYFFDKSFINKSMKSPDRSDGSSDDNGMDFTKAVEGFNMNKSMHTQYENHSEKFSDASNNYTDVSEDRHICLQSPQHTDCSTDENDMDFTKAIEGLHKDKSMYFQFQNHSKEVPDLSNNNTEVTKNVKHICLLSPEHTDCSLTNNEMDFTKTIEGGNMNKSVYPQLKNNSEVFSDISQNDTKASEGMGLVQQTDCSSSDNDMDFTKGVEGLNMNKSTHFKLENDADEFSVMNMSCPDASAPKYLCESLLPTCDSGRNMSCDNLKFTKNVVEAPLEICKESTKSAEMSIEVSREAYLEESKSSMIGNSISSGTEEMDIEVISHNAMQNLNYSQAFSTMQLTRLTGANVQEVSMEMDSLSFENKQSGDTLCSNKENITLESGNISDCIQDAQSINSLTAKKGANEIKLSDCAITEVANKRHDLHMKLQNNSGACYNEDESSNFNASDRQVTRVKGKCETSLSSADFDANTEMWRPEKNIESNNYVCAVNTEEDRCEKTNNEILNVSNLESSFASNCSPKHTTNNLIHSNYNNIIPRKEMTPFGQKDSRNSSVRHDICKEHKISKNSTQGKNHGKNIYSETATLHSPNSSRLITDPESLQKFCCKSMVKKRKSVENYEAEHCLLLPKKQCTSNCCNLCAKDCVVDNHKEVVIQDEIICKSAGVLISPVPQETIDKTLNTPNDVIVKCESHKKEVKIGTISEGIANSIIGPIDGRSEGSITHTVDSVTQNNLPDIVLKTTKLKTNSPTTHTVSDTGMARKSQVSANAENYPSHISKDVTLQNEPNHSLTNVVDYQNKNENMCVENTKKSPVLSETKELKVINISKCSPVPKPNISFALSLHDIPHTCSQQEEVTNTCANENNCKLQDASHYIRDVNSVKRGIYLTPVRCTTTGVGKPLLNDHTNFPTTEKSVDIEVSLSMAHDDVSRKTLHCEVDNGKCATSALDAKEDIKHDINDDKSDVLINDHQSKESGKVKMNLGPKIDADMVKYNGENGEANQTPVRGRNFFNETLAAIASANKTFHDWYSNHRLSTDTATTFEGEISDNALLKHSAATSSSFTDSKKEQFMDVSVSSNNKIMLEPSTEIDFPDYEMALTENKNEKALQISIKKAHTLDKMPMENHECHSPVNKSTKQFPHDRPLSRSSLTNMLANTPTKSTSKITAKDRSVTHAHLCSPPVFKSQTLPSELMKSKLLIPLPQNSSTAPILSQQGNMLLTQSQRDSPSPTQFQRGSPSPTQSKQASFLTIQSHQDGPLPTLAQRGSRSPTLAQRCSPLPTKVQRCSPSPTEAQRGSFSSPKQNLQGNLLTSSDLGASSLLQGTGADVLLQLDLQGRPLISQGTRLSSHSLLQSTPSSLLSSQSAQSSLRGAHLSPQVTQSSLQGAHLLQQGVQLSTRGAQSLPQDHQSSPKVSQSPPHGTVIYSQHTLSTMQRTPSPLQLMQDGLSSPQSPQGNKLLMLAQRSNLTSPWGGLSPPHDILSPPLVTLDKVLTTKTVVDGAPQIQSIIDDESQTRATLSDLTPTQATQGTLLQVQTSTDNLTQIFDMRREKSPVLDYEKHPKSMATRESLSQGLSAKKCQPPKLTTGDAASQSMPVPASPHMLSPSQGPLPLNPTTLIPPSNSQTPHSSMCCPQMPPNLLNEYVQRHAKRITLSSLAKPLTIPSSGNTVSPECSPVGINHDSSHMYLPLPGNSPTSSSQLKIFLKNIKPPCEVEMNVVRTHCNNLSSNSHQNKSETSNNDELSHSHSSITQEKHLLHNVGGPDAELCCQVICESSSKQVKVAPSDIKPIRKTEMLQLTEVADKDSLKFISLDTFHKEDQLTSSVYNNSTEQVILSKAEGENVLWRIKLFSGSHWIFIFLNDTLRLNVSFNDSTKEEIQDVVFASYLTDKADDDAKFVHHVLLNKFSKSRIQMLCRTVKEIPELLEKISAAVREMIVFLDDFQKICVIHNMKMMARSVTFDVMNYKLCIWFRVNIDLSSWEHISQQCVTITEFIGKISEKEIKNLANGVTKGPYFLRNYFIAIKQYMKILEKYGC